LNLGPISDEVNKKILNELEYKIRKIVEDSSKYAKHFNRDKINCNDISCAI